MFPDRPTIPGLAPNILRRSSCFIPFVTTEDLPARFEIPETLSPLKDEWLLVLVLAAAAIPQEGVYDKKKLSEF